MNDNLNNMRRRLLWRATRRGIKEMDLIVGGFAQNNLDSMDEQSLRDFANILEYSDQMLLAWMTKQETIPISQRSKLLDDILAFRPEIVE